MSDEADPPPEMWVTDVVGDGPETGAVVSNTRIKARDLTQSHLGKFVGCFDPDIGANYPAKILKIVHVNEGKVPGVSVDSTLRSAGRQACTRRAQPRAVCLRVRSGRDDGLVTRRTDG